MSFKQNMVWLLAEVLGSILLYKFWFLNEWQKIRIKYRVGSYKYKKVPALENKLVGSKRFYLCYKLKLVFYSLFFALLITCINLFTLADNKFSNTNDYLKLIVSLGTMYILVLGIRNPENNPHDNAISKMVNGFRKKCIVPLAEDEWNYYVNYIDKKVIFWYEDEKNSNSYYFAGLIIKLESELFEKIVEKDIDLNFDDDNVGNLDNNAITQQDALLRADLKNMPQSFMGRYVDGDPQLTLFNEVKKFLSDYLKLDKLKIYELVEFINDNEKCCKGRTRDSLIKTMEQKVNKSNKKAKSGKLKDVNKAIENLLENKKVTEHSENTESII